MGMVLRLTFHALDDNSYILHPQVDNSLAVFVLCLPLYDERNDQVLSLVEHKGHEV
jgi:hypothetical protein